MYTVYALLLVTVLYCYSVDSYRILGILPHTAKSHDYVFYPLFRGLAQKGHDVTVISHFPHEDHPKTYRHISLRGSLPVLDDALPMDTLRMSPLPFGFEKLLIHIQAMLFLSSYANTTCHALLANEEVQMLKEGQFDLSIIETFNSDCGLGIIDQLNVPFIGYSSHALMPWTKESLGLSENPSYLPTHFSDYGIHPTFFQRIKSFFVTRLCKFFYYHLITKTALNTLEKHYGKEFPNFQDGFKNMSLNLVNTYFPLHGTFEYPPSVVEIGGIHINKPKALPEDLQKYMDKSEHGIILFSMGSILRATTWPAEKLKAFQEAFAKLSQNILWKWENDTMPGAPANVKIVKWLPQLDILHHPNVKVFITHAGGLSLAEAAHCGVPVLAIPILGDQPNNAAAVKDSMFGEVLDYDYITTNSILNKLENLLSPKMQKNAKRLSAIWRDRRNSPLETAIYWVEHVIKHGGQHLRPVSADLPLYQYLLLDILAFFILLGLLFVSLVSKLCFRSKTFSMKKKLKKK